MSDDIIPQRPCKNCGNTFSRTPEFWHKDKSSKDGLSYSCKECSRNRAKNWQHDNKEYANQQARDYYAAHKEERRQYIDDNTEQVAAGKRRWRQNNPEKVAAEKKRHAEKHKDHIRNYQKKWNARRRAQGIKRQYTPEQRKAASERSCRWAKLNPERSLNHSHIRRARIKTNGGAGFFKEDKELQLRSQKGNCWWCGKPMGEDGTIDHIRPIARGGQHDPRNIVLCHKSCNCSKKDKLPQEWNGRLF